jgi:hypothetical protein
VAKTVYIIQKNSLAKHQKVVLKKSIYSRVYPDACIKKTALLLKASTNTVTE